jgi:hypothetical protein
MQVAIEAKDGFVLASDLKHRTGGGTGIWVYGYGHQSKIYHCEKHAVAIALQGHTFEHWADPGTDLVKWLNDSSDSSRDEILRWANQYQKHEADDFSLLIVNPTAPYDKMWRLRIKGGNVKDSRAEKWIAFHGNENNPAIMWPELLKCNGQKSINESTRIAALTLLAAEEISQISVSGLEVWRFSSKWECLSDDELGRLRSMYSTLRKYLDSLIIGSQT